MKDYWLNLPFLNGKINPEIAMGFFTIAKALDSLRYEPIYALKEIISDYENNYKIYCNFYEQDSSERLGECMFVINKIHNDTEKKNEYKLIDYTEHKS